MAAGATDSDIRLLALKGVRDIAWKPELRMKLAEADGLSRVLGLLDSPCPEIRAAAAEALAALCCNQPSIAASIADLGALPQLLAFARRLMYRSVEGPGQDPSGKGGIAATLVLCNMAINAEIKLQLAQQSVITLLVDLLQIDGVPEKAYKYAIATLSKMMINPQIVMSNFEARCVFFQLLSALENVKGSESLPEYAAGALAILVAKGSY